VNPAERVLLYVHTARNLKPAQLLYWPLRRIQRALPAPSIFGTGRPHATRFPSLAERVVSWGPDDLDSRLGMAESVTAGVFNFVGVEKRLSQIDWTHRYVNHLWNFNLHYFDYAVDLAWAARQGSSSAVSTLEGLIGEWLRQTSNRRGDAWEPYTISTRIVNWLKALAIAGDALGSDTSQAIWNSIYSQANVLARRLELHLDGNHLQRNFSALFMAGGALSGSEAEGWYSVGISGVGRMIKEQVLPDGCHVERSPMYHCIALGDFLECADVAATWGSPLDESSRHRLRQMSQACDVLMRADGTIHLFNDSANGVAPSRAHLERLAHLALDFRSSRQEGSIQLPDSGYFGLCSDADRFVIDCGEPGPLHQPGHAHCDLLSFELDIAGRPVIVDSGVSGYAGDPLRSYQRSTRAHNTLEINGGEQSEIWATFRMGRQARVTLPGRARQENGEWIFEGEYSPYFDRKLRHRRRAHRTAQGAWVVTDTVSGGYSVIRSFLHFHPDFSLTEAETGRWLAANGDIIIEVTPFGIDTASCVRASMEPAQGWFSGHFGRPVAASVLVMERVGPGQDGLGFTIERIA
jgi:uncharacterized heparinase superfamily protein